MPEREGANFEERKLWSAGEGEYHTYRIPAMVVTTTGSILAFCEGRKFPQTKLGLRADLDGHRRGRG